VLPVFTAAEMRALDARAIATLGLPGSRLMEAAGTGAAAVVARRFGPLRGRRVVVVCGRGNNGGDGFVVARRLAARGARVRVYLAGARADVKGDAALALRRWRGPVAEVAERPGLARLERELAGAHVVVDALLGTGLSGPARGLIADLIEAINRSGRPVVALDVPSGVDSDRGQVLGPAVRAHITATFAGYKRALLLHPACELAGEVSVVPSASRSPRSEPASAPISWKRGTSARSCPRARRTATRGRTVTCWWWLARAASRERPGWPAGRRCAAGRAW
jgi:hydroxyethylthiazole kinase-like uncharacterized protein yjeF